MDTRATGTMTAFKAVMVAKYVALLAKMPLTLYKTMFKPSQHDAQKTAKAARSASLRSAPPLPAPRRGSAATP